MSHIRHLWKLMMVPVCWAFGHKYGPWMFAPIKADLCWRCLRASQWDTETRTQ